VEGLFQESGLSYSFPSIEPLFPLTVSYTGHLELNQLVNNIFQGSPEARSTTFEEQYFLVSMNIEASSDRLSWVNRKIFVGRGRFELGDGKVGLVYEVGSIE